VFDEATNSLDAVSIRKILNAITEELRGVCTIIVISHQLSTIQHADRIVVVENGRLSEIGTHEQLSKRNGLYHKLVRIQQQTEATL
jgi:ABC-type multidrug transport system fused ATPase/permease subunit